MYKKMLVLLDGSEPAEVVFSYAQELSGRLGIDLELLHVASPHEADQLPMRQGYIEHKAELLCTQAEKIRAAAGAEAVNECISARGTVVVGDPAEEILAYLDTNEVDLVMMSTHGRSGSRGFDLGGVANKIVHASKVPVWLVPSELREEVMHDTLPQRTLVVPLTGTKMSEAVLPHALTIARQRGAESLIVLLHVRREMPTTHLNYSQAKEREAELRRMDAYLDRTAEAVEKAGFSARVQILHGEPAKSIIEFLKYNPPQLIAMATRGHTGLSRMVFGSVTENVIHLIKKTPMLLVSAED